MSGHEWLDIYEAATYTRYSTGRVRKAAQAGELLGQQACHRGRWRFTRADLDAWVQQRRPSPVRAA